MRKWTYLVAALLIGGVSTSLTSCIDTDEPAGITDLRGAKAELLRAKAQVELAEAAIKNAQAAYEQAKADIKAQEAEREKLYTDYMTAKYEDEKAKLQEEAEIRKQANLEKLYQAQQAAKQAELDYQRALAEIEIALSTVKDDAYATALYELLNNKEFTVPNYTIAIGPSGEVTITPGTSSSKTVRGLIGLSTEIADVKETIANITQQQLILDYTFDKDAMIADVDATILVKKAELKVAEETLAELKQIAGTAIEDFEAKYKEIEDKKKEAENQKTEVDVNKAKDLAENYDPQNQELTIKENALTALTFEIPDAVQNGFHTIVNDLKTAAASDANKTAIYDNILNQSVANTEDEYSFPNGLSVNLKIADKKTIIGEIKTEVEAKANAEDVDGLKQAMDLAVANEEHLKGSYDEALKAFTDAAKVYDDAYKAGNYHLTDASDRDNVIATYQTYLDALGTTDEAAAQTAFVTAYTSYLAKRTLLDGFKPATNMDITQAADLADLQTKLAAFNTAYSSNPNACFGNANATEAGGYYQDMTDAAADLGVKVEDRSVTYSYEQWKEDNATSPATIPSEVTPTSAIYKYYTAMDETADATQAYEDAVAVTDWGTLLTNIEKVEESVLAEDNALQLEKIALAKVKQEIEAKYSEQAATLQAQINSYNDILDAMAVAVPDIDNVGGGAPISQATYEQAIANIKDEIAEYEGATIDQSNGTIALGSISEIKEEVALYENLKKGLEDGTYQAEQEITKEYNNAMIEAYSQQLEVLEALFDKANKQKQQYLDALANGTTTPEVPDGGEGGETETPAE